MSTPDKPIALQATERDTTLNPRQLRRAGFVPATLYGPGVESQSIQVRTQEFTLQFTQGVRIFELNGLSSPLTVRAHKLQIHPVSHAVLSLEFLVLDARDVRQALADEAQRQSLEKAAREQAYADAAEAVSKPEVAPEAPPAADAPAEPETALSNA